MNRWYESAFIREAEEDKINWHGIPADDTSSPPQQSQDSVVEEIRSAPNYTSAWHLFSEAYRDLLNTGIPSGSGAFEEWWTNKNSDGDFGPGAGIPITVEDLERLQKDASNYGEVSGILSNVFYNGRNINITDDALEFLLREGIPQAVEEGGDVELLEGWFGDYDAEDIQAALDHPRLMNGLIRDIIQQYRQSHPVHQAGGPLQGAAGASPYDPTEDENFTYEDTVL